MKDNKCIIAIDFDLHTSKEYCRDIKRTIVNDDTYSYDSILQYYKGKYKKNK